MNEWEDLGIRSETVADWQALDVTPFLAALAQGDGYGPSSARHHLDQLRRVARSWRDAGLADLDGLRWHRAGFGALEAVRWRGQGTDLDAAAVAAGHRMVG